MNCKVLSCAFESQVCFAGQYPIKERTVYQKKKPSIVSEGSTQSLSGCSKEVSVALFLCKGVKRGLGVTV